MFRAGLLINWQHFARACLEMKTESKHGNWNACEVGLTDGAKYSRESERELRRTLDLGTSQPVAPQTPNIPPCVECDSKETLISLFLSPTIPHSLGQVD